MSVSHRRHVDDLPLDELHAVVLGEQTDFGHSVEVLHRDAVPLRLLLHEGAHEGRPMRRIVSPSFAASLLRARRDPSGNLAGTGEMPPEPFAITSLWAAWYK